MLMLWIGIENEFKTNKIRNMPIQYRIAEEKDLLEIVALLSRDDLGKDREKYQNPLPESYLNAFKNITLDRNQELIVMIENNRILGTLQISYLQYLTYQGGMRAQIEAVRVHEDCRGKGYGSLLIQWAVDRSRAKGVHLVQLTTDKKRPKALEFYEKLGFIASHEGMKMFL